MLLSRTVVDVTGAATDGEEKKELSRISGKSDDEGTKTGESIEDVKSEDTESEPMESVSSS